MADLMRALPMTRPSTGWPVRPTAPGPRAPCGSHPQGPRRRHLRKHVLIVEDIVYSGLTLSWIRANLESRNPASVEIVTLLRKPEAAKVEVDVKWVGFDIPNEFVVGYGLDYAEQYRGLRQVGTLAPHVYS